MSILLNCVTIQKKLSLACDTIADPAPMAITTTALENSVPVPMEFIMGATIDAAVINATVDDPCAVFMAAAIKNGSQMPMDIPLIPEKSSPKPEFCSTLPKAPPAPVIMMIVAAFLMAFPVHPVVLSISLSNLRGRNNAIKTPINKAITGFPMKRIN